MAVTAVNKFRQSAEYTEQGTRVVEWYRVEFDAVPDDARDALDASFGGTSIPNRGDSYQGQTFLLCKRVGPAEQMDESRTVYIVPVEYGNPTGSGGVVTRYPLSRPADIFWSFDVVEKVLERDIGGTAILNTAGDPFDPPIMGEEYRLTCTIERNVVSFDPSLALSIIDTKNGSDMTIAGASISAGQALMKDYSAQAVYENETDYIRERIVIQFAPDHDRTIANLGYYFIDASDSNKRKHVKDSEGRDDVKPHFIKVEGTAGDDNGVGTANATYVTFEVKNWANWASLNLPTQFPD